LIYINAERHYFLSDNQYSLSLSIWQKPAVLFLYNIKKEI